MSESYGMEMSFAKIPRVLYPSGASHWHVYEETVFPVIILKYLFSAYMSISCCELEPHITILISYIVVTYIMTRWYYIFPSCALSNMSISGHWVPIGKLKTPPISCRNHKAEYIYQVSRVNKLSLHADLRGWSFAEQRRKIIWSCNG